MKLSTLMYHDVIGPDGVRGGFEGAGAGVYAVSADEFERQMDGIERVLGEPPLRADAPLPPRGGWLLTFDDGGSSAALAGAALARRGWAAHFFVVTERVGQPGFLDWEGVRRLAAEGHVIGSHSHTHPQRIGSLPPERLREEWSRSVTALSEAIDAPVTTASVPGGYYSDAVGGAAAEVGIATLFTSQPRRAMEGIEGCALVGRFAVRGSTPTQTVVSAAAGKVHPWLRQRAGWAARGAAKRIGGRHYERLRRVLLSRR
ncbi:MAG TPA: polysaccharide deacetylase family protein [Solirubrobacterales bacterium]|nr:polysaccharide deacetylase family protein [Solirubrobacterales bacterium]